MRPLPTDECTLLSQHENTDQPAPLSETATTRGPRLVPAQSRPLPQRQFSALALWHLLSLDAPTVAALWTYFVARSVGIYLPWITVAAMFVAVWMIYAADRLLDAKALDFAATDLDAYGLEERHHFHHRHRSRYLFALALAAVVLISLLPRLSPEALLRYCLLATVLGVWMLIIHARHQNGAVSQRLPKELVVGIFFPAAVFVPTVVRVPSMQFVLLFTAVLFACVCTLNCLFVYAWEHPDHRPTKGAAHWTTRYAVRHLPWLVLITLLACFLLAATTHASRLPAFACAISCALLLGLHQIRHRVSAVHLRASADLVLLTPFLLMPPLPR